MILVTGGAGFIGSHIARSLAENGEDGPLSSDGTATQDPQKPNIRTQLLTFIQTLASKQATDDVKSYDLVWLTHLIGDVHNPSIQGHVFLKPLQKETMEEIASAFLLIQRYRQKKSSSRINSKDIL